MEKEKRKSSNKRPFKAYLGLFLSLLIALPLVYVFCNISLIIINTITEYQHDARIVEPIIQTVCQLPDYQTSWQKFSISDDGLGSIYTDTLEEERIQVNCYWHDGAWQCNCIEPENSLDEIATILEETCSLSDYRPTMTNFNLSSYNYQDFLSEEKLYIRCYYSGASWMCNCRARG